MQSMGASATKDDHDDDENMGDENIGSGCGCWHVFDESKRGTDVDSLPWANELGRFARHVSCALSA